jgi:hypothetical protein
MIFSVLHVLVSVLAQVVEAPFKPNDEFQLTMDYKFKPRPTLNNSNLHIDFTNDSFQKKSSDGPLPFLAINFKMVKLADNELRVKVVDNFNRTILTKKAKAGDEFKIELGYTDDMKDMVTANEYNVYFLSPEKSEVSRVHLLIMEDGTFLVNGEKRGKF